MTTPPRSNFPRNSRRAFTRWFAAVSLGLLWGSAPSLLAAPATHEEVLRRWAAKAPAELRAVATQGNAEAQHVMADTLLKSATSAVQRAEAIQWLQRAADQKLAAAEAALGTAYFEGKHIPEDYVAGWRWMRAAAEQGLPYAQNYLGVACSNGWGTNPDARQAVRWFQAARAQNFLPAFNNLGWMTMRGQGGLVPDEAAGVKLILMAAERGHARSQADVGWMYQHGLHRHPKDPVAALDWFKQSALQGFSPGQYHLANALALGTGTPPDLLAALDLYRKAADQGHAEACLALGDLYATGEASPRNAADSAHALYERAGEAGNAQAAERLADRLRWGYACLPDRLKACGWFCQATINHYGQSESQLVPQVDEESRQFAALFSTHRRACQRRDPAALLQMGRWCVEGVVAPMDLVEACKWFTLAQQRGDATAQTELARLRSRLTPEQIKDAERRVAKMNR